MAEIINAIKEVGSHCVTNFQGFQILQNQQYQLSESIFSNGNSIMSSY